MQVREYKHIFELPNDLTPFLLKNEIQNNRVIGLLNLLQTDKSLVEDPSFFIVSDLFANTIGVAIWLKSRPLTFSLQSLEAISAILKTIQSRLREVSSIFGIRILLEPMIKNFQLNNAFPHIDLQGCYQLTQVISPTKALDLVRIADTSDMNFLLDAYKNFQKESNGISDDNQAESWINNHLRQKNLYVGLKEDIIVCCGLIGLTLPNGRVISFMYTPKNQRNKGFASDLIAHLSQIVLDMGCQYACLYTKLSNTTANKIYQNVGYQRKDDFIFLAR